MDLDSQKGDYERDEAKGIRQARDGQVGFTASLVLVGKGRSHSRPQPRIRKEGSTQDVAMRGLIRRASTCAGVIPCRSLRFKYAANSVQS